MKIRKQRVPVLYVEYMGRAFNSTSTISYAYYNRIYLTHLSQRKRLQRVIE